ncbi:hypothetical protein [Ralstonia phage phiITL-1]|uniref:Uncharacterized protein n=1 Tax=Ralstonia phage phiITL-1 TaxID=1597967 RepID=A0A0U1ZAC0_9CAUD|nr:hypothetical protein HOR02_gp17 [Ralstonia phage phiITL-1]AJT60801.1 hypothetical protein [Ralstonia phage phiITL-1]
MQPSKVIFATSVNTSSCGGKTTRTLAHATLDVRHPDGLVTITNRAGQSLNLDKDAAEGLLVALQNLFNR